MNSPLGRNTAHPEATTDSTASDGVPPTAHCPEATPKGLALDSLGFERLVEEVTARVIEAPHDR